MSKDYYFFGESAYFSNDQEKENAKKYLEFWKKNLIRKLNRDTYSVDIFNEQWGERDAYLSGCLEQYSTIYLKLSIRIKFNFEVNSYLGSCPERES